MMTRLHTYEEWEEINEAGLFKTALMAIALVASSLVSKSQCSAVLQAAMQNPNNPKNAAILSGIGVDMDAKINAENGFGEKYEMLSKEDKELLKKQALEDKEAAKEEVRKWNQKFNPYLDYTGEHLDSKARKQYVQDFENFTKNHPEFAKEKSSYSLIERYAFIHKEVSFLNTRMKYWLKDRLNTIFNPNEDPNKTISEEEFYKMLQSDKIKGFDNFISMYVRGFNKIGGKDVEYSKFWRGE